jgi:hypothetical protein
MSPGIERYSWVPTVIHQQNVAKAGVGDDKLTPQRFSCNKTSDVALIEFQPLKRAIDAG